MKMENVYTKETVCENQVLGMDLYLFTLEQENMLHLSCLTTNCSFAQSKRRKSYKSNSNFHVISSQEIDTFCLATVGESCRDQSIV